MLVLGADTTRAIRTLLRCRSQEVVSFKIVEVSLGAEFRNIA